MNAIRWTAWGCLALLLLVGCDDDSPTGPQVGTITIDAEPNSIGAPWTLTGPNGYFTQGAGDLTLPDLVAGSYTVTWGTVGDWIVPHPSVQTLPLHGGSLLLFVGVYAPLDPVPPEGFVYIAPGTFMMGSPVSEPFHNIITETQHTVTLTRGFYMSKYEVTEQWWAEVMGGTPTASQLPMEYVSWMMAVKFCNALSLREGLAPAYTILSEAGDVTWDRNANGYRLPTEAEWEYACRAGTTSAFNNGTNCLSSDTEANFGGSWQLTGCPPGAYRAARTNVGSFPANAWGLHDMHGNLWEWVWDGFRADYQNLPAEDPVHDGEPTTYRLFRGGSWSTAAWLCRSADRGSSRPAGFDHGFRPVRFTH